MRGPSSWKKLSSSVPSFKKFDDPGKNSAFVTMAELLSSEQRKAYLEPLLNNRWRLVEGRDAISRNFVFADFKECFKFMTQVADKAEELNHHPEWSNVYNRLEITWSTHDCQGLSMLDIEMANFCDEIF